MTNRPIAFNRRGTPRTVIGPDCRINNRMRMIERCSNRRRITLTDYGVIEARSVVMRSLSSAPCALCPVSCALSSVPCALCPVPCAWAPRYPPKKHPIHEGYSLLTQSLINRSVRALPERSSPRMLEAMTVKCPEFDSYGAICILIPINSASVDSAPRAARGSLVPIPFCM